MTKPNTQQIIHKRAFVPHSTIQPDGYTKKYQKGVSYCMASQPPGRRQGTSTPDAQKVTCPACRNIMASGSVR